MLGSSKLFLFTLLVMLAASCQESLSVEPAFYYWKNSAFRLEKEEREAVKATSPKKLYVKFFEVAPDPVHGSIPIAKMKLDFWPCVHARKYHYEYDSIFCDSLKGIEIIPTVFIQNKVLKEIATSEIDSLASNVNFLVNKYYNDEDFKPERPFKEIQIDCDWTESTRDAYFEFLEVLKGLTTAEISVTLRLYPFKYREKMGVPPVSKAMLMCYNFFNPLQRLQENSIQNNNEMELYLKGADQYPIHLDVALPIFNYAFLYHNKQFSGVLHGFPKQFKNFCSPTENPNIFYVEKDTLLNERFLRAGDALKIENVDYANSLETIDLLKKYIDFDGKTTVSIFHLDAEEKNELNHEEINSIFTYFAK